MTGSTILYGAQKTRLHKETPRQIRSPSDFSVNNSRKITLHFLARICQEDQIGHQKHFVTDGNEGHLVMCYTTSRPTLFGIRCT